MSFPTIEERVRAAEAAGFESVWFMDHLAAPAATHLETFEGWTTAAAIAARTTRIRIGHLVLADPFRHPAVLAKMAATLDVISGGRLELGLGWGSVASELAAFGITADPPAARAARLAETLEILERMWTGEPFSYRGAHFQLDGAVGQPRPVHGRIPLLIGGGGPRLTMPLVARFADWWNCPGYALTRLDELRDLAGKARLSVQHVVGLARSSAERAEVRATAERRFRGWGGIVTGVAEEVAAELRAERDRGVERFIIQLADFGPPETIERFAAEVIPLVASA